MPAAGYFRLLRFRRLRHFRANRNFLVRFLLKK
jgi:hypothetical protein